MEKEIVAKRKSLKKPHKGSSKYSNKGMYIDILADKMAVIDSIHSGISIDVIDNYRKQVALSKEQISAVLNLSSKTLDRYKAEKKLLKKAQAERFFGLIEVYKEGVEVFGTLEKFNIWLTDANFALGSNRPIDLLVDSYGKDLVLTELVNIDEGILV